MNEKVEMAIRVLADQMQRSEDAAKAFTCGEVDSIARVLALTSFEREAASVLLGHASGDEAGDAHFHITLAQDRGFAEEDMEARARWEAEASRRAFDYVRDFRS